MKILVSFRTCLACMMITVALSLQSVADEPPSVANGLKKMGIGLDHVSLCKALLDKRPVVRGLAAAELGEQKDRLAIPVLEAALDRESDQAAVYSIAASLASFNVDKGAIRLEEICRDDSLDMGMRTGAANALASVNQDFKCAPYMLGLLSSPDESLRESALLYLARVPAAESGLAAFGPPLLAVATGDPNSFLRELASKALLKIGDDGSKRAWLSQHAAGANPK